MWGTRGPEGWRPGARSPWGQTPASHSCSLLWLGNRTGMLHLSLSKVRMQCAAPSSCPWKLRVGGAWKAHFLASAFPSTRGQGRRKHARTRTRACTDRFSCRCEHMPCTHTHPQSTRFGTRAQGLLHRLTCTHIHAPVHTHFHTSRGTFIPTHFQTHT